MTASSLGERSAVLAGRYRVERVLAHGGMGIVVQATHLQLNQLAAVKFLRPVVVPPIAGGVIDLVLQACEALAIDIVHRDMACMTGAIPAAATAVRDPARPAGPRSPRRDLHDRVRLRARGSVLSTSPAISTERSHLPCTEESL